VRGVTCHIVASVVNVNCLVTTNKKHSSIQLNSIYCWLFLVVDCVVNCGITVPHQYNIYSVLLLCKSGGYIRIRITLYIFDLFLLFL
jgi:hypothetical protein